MSSALVCLSGGLDSTVSLYWACKNYDHVEAAFFNYGQKAYESEKKAVQFFSKELGFKVKEFDLRFLKDFSASALNKENLEVPSGDDVNIEDEGASIKTAQAVWVPNRNGLFINVAASYAESQGVAHLVLGFNKEEAQTFPDNSKEFIEAVNGALNFSTQNRVQVVSPTLHLGKIEIVSMGRKLGVDFSKVWPCYKSGAMICGQCESCKRFLRAQRSLR